MKRSPWGLGRICVLLLALGVMAYTVGGVLSLQEYRSMPEAVRADAPTGPVAATLLWTGVGLCAAGGAALCVLLVRRVRRLSR
ncbi:hypothetical protein [Micrococcus sp.]|uniref:hypothetical protein n=1 Tax=Micrococcus sp. TaxID=1271 RepID=UPI002A913533|nr:hypothetical protein [Micrococcus sp.]MDY6056060.1 hypothetical protein [Micrococcus sp.]